MRRLVLLIFLLSFIMPVGAEEILTLSVSTDSEIYEAGDRGVLILTFTNESDQLVENIEVRVRSNDILFLDKTASIESILYGSEPVEFRFQIKNLENGSYPVHISYSYLATSKICQGGVCQKMSDKKTHEITVKNGEPRISLQSTVLTAQESRTVITFKNAGAVAIDFQFELICDLTLQYEMYIGYLLSSSSKEIVVYGEPGEYEGSVKVTYKDRFNRTYKNTFPITIVIEGAKDVPTKKLVMLQPRSGEEIRKIEINVASTGKSPASQYFVYLMMFSCFLLIGTAALVKVKNSWK